MTYISFVTDFLCLSKNYPLTMFFSYKFCLRGNQEHSFSLTVLMVFEELGINSTYIL